MQILSFTSRMTRDHVMTGSKLGNRSFHSAYLLELFTLSG